MVLVNLKEQTQSESHGPSDQDTSTKYEVGSFLCLRGDIIENMLQSNVRTFVFREQLVNTMNLGGTSSMVTATSGMWMQHAQEPSWSAKPSKLNSQFVIAR